ncbi:MAG: hypothetical protein IKG67_01295 [Parasporobacterium sp.]|nr:hypothetical protein [Parasporobacterium sp.]
MKKISLVTIGVTGALILTTAATALAAPSGGKEQAENDTQTILSSSTAKSAPTELPERLQGLELPEGITLSDNKEETDLTPPEKPEGEDMKPFTESEGSDNDNRKPFTEGSRFKSAFVPKLRPETKPEGEDMVPPEFEGIEQIDQLGRPEFSEEGMPEGMPEDMPENMPENMPGESEGRPDFRGESAHERQFDGEMPEDMQGEFGGQRDFRGESEGQPNFRGESAPDEQFGKEVAL